MAKKRRQPPDPHRAERARLRLTLRVWQRGSPNELHVDYCIVCPATVGLGPCEGQACEGCMATAYRRDRAREIERLIVALTPTAELPEPVQTSLFG
jgi:hypothetical protein